MVDDDSDVNSLLVVPISRVGLHRSDEDILFDAPICNKNLLLYLHSYIKPWKSATRHTSIVRRWRWNMKAWMQAILRCRIWFFWMATKAALSLSLFPWVLRCCKCCDFCFQLVSTKSSHLFLKTIVKFINRTGHLCWKSKFIPVLSHETFQTKLLQTEA